MDFTTQYRNGLEQLTFNSKIIINSLTMIAAENMDKSVQVVELVTANSTLEHVYLMDSILKNVGGRYIPLFEARIIKFTVSVYKMNKLQILKLVNTWKTYPSKLFAKITIEGLERELIEAEVLELLGYSTDDISLQLKRVVETSKLDYQTLNSILDQLKRQLNGNNNQPQNLNLANPNTHIIKSIDTNTQASNNAVEIELTQQAINKISDLKLYENLDLVGTQCKQCGLRLDDLVSHLDWHFRSNRAVVVNHYYSSLEQWITEDCFVEVDVGCLFDTKTKLEKVDDVQMLVSLTHNDKCSVCSEKFVKVFEDSIDDWVYKDCLAQGKSIYHSFCKKSIESPQIVKKIKLA